MEEKASVAAMLVKLRDEAAEKLQLGKDVLSHALKTEFQENNVQLVMELQDVLQELVLGDTRLAHGIPITCISVLVVWLQWDGMDRDLMGVE